MGPDYPFVYRSVDARGPFPKASGGPWRVGLVKTHTWANAEPYAREAIERLADRISSESGFEVADVCWPEEFHGAHDVHSTIYRKSLSYYFQQEAKLSSHLSPIMSEMIADGQSIGLAEFRQALAWQEAFSAALDLVLSEYDVVLSLATSSVAPPRGAEELPDPSLLWTLGHVPAISAPAFVVDDLPLGAQFIARRWDDYRLLQGVEELVDRGVLPAGSSSIARWR
jgi:Asp-tRNA(Asn)/Glu-tRNA(Gln) amidotransferase A subunit family amidase